MHDAENRITIDLGVGDDANRHQVVHFLERNTLALHFLMNGVQVFGTSDHPAGQPGLGQRVHRLLNDRLDVILPFLVPFRHPKLQHGIGFGLEVLKA